MSILSSPTMKGLVAGAAAGAMLLGGSPAHADAPGAGVFTGRELAPDSTLYTPPITLCATFTPTTGPDLVHELALTGTFHGVVGTGTAVYTNSTTNYDASPLGTFTAGTNCISAPFAVPGSMNITFGSNSCQGTATYLRVQSAYTLQFSGNCSVGGDTQVVFTGVQEPCPPALGCPIDPDASALMQGDYAQIG